MSAFVRVLDDILPPAFCDELIGRFLRDASVYDGTTGLGLHPTRKLSQDLDLTGEPWRDVRAALLRGLLAGLERYTREVPAFSALSALECAGFRMRRYPPGGFFDWHVDSFDWDTSRRVLAVIFYLNTPARGGETEFKYRDARVAPLRGRLALFPTSFDYVHRSVPTEDAEKYVVVSFLQHRAPAGEPR